MSIVVAVSKNQQTVMASDTLTSFGDSQRVPAENAATAKIMRVGSSVVGGAGWGIYGNILVDFLRERPAPDLSGEQAIFSFFLELWRALHERYPFVNDQAQSRDTPFGDLDTSFLIANDSGIYKISHDMDVCRFQQYFAIGSGSEYALGALGVLFEQETDASAIVRRVVQIAMRFDAHCGGPIDVQSV